MNNANQKRIDAMNEMADAINRRNDSIGLFAPNVKANSNVYEKEEAQYEKAYKKWFIGLIITIVIVILFK